MCKHTASQHKGMLCCRRKRKNKNYFKRHLSHCSSNTVDYFHPGTLITHSYPLKAVAAYILNPANNIKTHPPLFFCFSTRSHAIIFHSAVTRLIHLWYKCGWWNAEFLNQAGQEKNKTQNTHF